MAVVSRPGRSRAALLQFPGAPQLRGLTLRRLLPSGRALLVGFGLLAAGAAAYVGARQTSVFALRSIEITGASARVAAHVRTALTPLEGRSLLVVNAAAIQRRVEGLSDVAAVSYDRDFPHSLHVVVTPAHSIAVLRRGPLAWIVSSDGSVVRTTGLLGAPKLPRIWIPRASDVAVGGVIENADALRAVRALAVARAGGLVARVSAVRSSEQELTFVLSSGLEIRCGGSADLPLKVAVAERILKFVGHSNAYIDVSVPERPIAAGNLRVSSGG
jgi:cell division protein FtsQ